MKSGFVTFVGRPNVGKSTLLNHILGEKVSIVSDKVQTTRNQIRGVLTRPDAQLVFVDTPGIHKPVTPLGDRLNAAATDAIGGVDIVCFLVDATQPIGKGDRFVAQRVPKDGVVVVNVFASWCVPCRAEHGVLTNLRKEEDILLFGIKYKDKPEDATRWLANLGNPYDRIGSDLSGRAGIEWGISGVPETFIVSQDGIVLHRTVGPIVGDAAVARFKAALAAARTATEGNS